MDATTQGRADLVAWTQAQPSDLFTDDDALVALVAEHGLDAYQAQFEAAGQVVAGPLDVVVR